MKDPTGSFTGCIYQVIALAVTVIAALCFLLWRFLR